MFKYINRRAVVTLLVFICFCVMLVTSVLMFAWRHNDSVAMLHTLLGFTLLLVVIWHLKNNFSPFKHYFKWRTSGVKTKINVALPIAIIFAVVWISLSLVQFSPFLAIYNWGNTLRVGDKVKDDLQFTYTRIDKVQAEAKGAKLTVDLRKGPYFLWPQYAIWLETLDGEFIQPLFITQKIAHNKFSNKATKRDQSQVLISNPFASNNQDIDSLFTFESDPNGESTRIRPESLPVFLHQLAIQTSGGVFVPTEHNPIVDAYAGATMLNNFLLSTRSDKPLPDKYRVRFEINQSFDFNDYYSSNRFPDDPVYSGNGFSGQPSVVYEAIVDASSSQHYFPMTLIGRGHHSGKDGQVHYDMENITTADQIVDRIIVELP